METPGKNNVMPGTKRTIWQLATVVEIRAENPTVKTYRLQLPDWHPHQAGQHYLLRLTAADGYQARRSYSIASPPEQKGEIELTIERLAEGEVSTYLHDVVKVGEQLEVRGPLGGYFIWKARYKSPLWLIAGGSGIVPLMSIIRHHQAAASTVPVRLLYSTQSPATLIYPNDLKTLSPIPQTITYTRESPPDWQGYQRRIDREMLAEELAEFPSHPLVYVCGPTPMVEFVAHALVELGIPGVRVRTERFGPSGA
jgi:ferredoxin-NADP reductase